mgnify:CR=1 FL=1
MATANADGSAKARIAVLVSGGGTNLQALIDAEKSGKLKSGSICLVISNKKDAFALQRAFQNQPNLMRTIQYHECLNHPLHTISYLYASLCVPVTE